MLRAVRANTCRHVCQSRYLAEALESRYLLAVAEPFFVIVHGAQINSDALPLWTTDMAIAIKDRLDMPWSDQQVTNAVVRYDTKTVQAPANSATNFLIYDWAAVSGLLSPFKATSDQVAGELARLVEARLNSFPNASPYRDVHFIGHSRGAFVINQAIKNMLRDYPHNSLGTLQQTTLDPKSFGDGTLDVPQGVVADNYFQTSTLTFHGATLPGALNIDLTERLDNWTTSKTNNHSEVHDWYQWTIDETDQSQQQIDDDYTRYAQAGTDHLGHTPQEVCSNRRLLYAGIDPNGAIGFGQNTHELPDSCGLSVVTVIDRSRSMLDDGKITAAKSAAGLFTKLLDTGDSIGVVSFADSANTDFSLTPIEPDSSAKSDAVNTINSLSADGGTAISDGINEAATDLSSVDDRVGRTIVLLSDGRETEDNNESTNPVAAAEALPDDIRVFTIALGADADQETLRQIAQATGGQFLFAPSAGELKKLYTEFLSPVTGGQQLLDKDSSINPGGDVSFPIDVPASGSVLFGVNYGGSDLDLTLTAPNGSIISHSNRGGAELQEGTGFEFLRVADALPGNWTMKVHGTVVPNLAYPFNAYAIARDVFASPIGRSGTANDLAFATDGTLHFAWYDSLDQKLKYASRDPDGSWSDVQTVDTSGDNVGVYLSLAVSPAGEPAIAYFDASTGDLRFASLSGASWTTQVIDSVGSVGLYPSLRFDNAGQPAIAYYRKTSGDLKFASFDGAVWGTRKLDTRGDCGRSVSMTNKADGFLSMAYADSTTGNLKYLEQGSKGWRDPVVIDDSLVGGVSFISLSVDPGGSERVSYYDAGPANLKYAARKSHKKNNWDIVTVASKLSVGLYSKLIFSQRGLAYIFYYKKNSDTLFMASNSRLNPDVFALTQISADGGKFISIATSPKTHKFTCAFFNSDSGSLDVRDLA